MLPPSGLCFAISSEKVFLLMLTNRSPPLSAENFLLSFSIAWWVPSFPACTRAIRSVSVCAVLSRPSTKPKNLRAASSGACSVPQGRKQVPASAPHSWLSAKVVKLSYAHLRTSSAPLCTQGQASQESPRRMTVRLACNSKPMVPRSLFPRSLWFLPRPQTSPQSYCPASNHHSNRSSLPWTTLPSPSSLSDIASALSVILSTDSVSSCLALPASAFSARCGILPSSLAALPRGTRF